MSKKKLVFSSLFFSSIPLTAAQLTGGGGSFQGILPMISEVLGLNISDPYVALGILATVGVMDIVAYIVLKQGAKKLEIEDTVLPGSHDNSRNILAILSTLITISIFGTGAAMGLIGSFQSLFILGFSFVAIGGIIFLLVGGGGGLFGGTAYLTGKSTKMAAEGVEETAEGLNQADNALERANDLLQGAEEEEEEGRERGENGDKEGEREEEKDAERRLNKVLQILDRVEDEFEEVLEANKTRIDDAIKELEEAEEDEEVEEKAEVDIVKRVNTANVFMQVAVETIQSEGGIDKPHLKNGGGPYRFEHDRPKSYGLLDVGEDLQNVEKRLEQIVSNIKDEEGFIGDALKELLEAADEVITIHKDTYELKELLQEAENDTEFMEKLSKEEQFQNLFSGARDEEEFEKTDLEPKLEKITEEENEIYDYLKRADEMVEKHLKLNKTVISLLEEQTKYSKDSLIGMLIGGDNSLYDLSEALLNEASDLGESEIVNIIGPADDDGTLLFYLRDIENHVEGIEGELNSEYKKEQQEIQRLEEHLSQW